MPEDSVERPDLFPSRRRLLIIVLAVQATCWVLVRAAHGLLRSWRFDGFPADGPFQVLNPLRRIAAGQRGGIDFQFFHGLGLPYLHFPVYSWFGETIHAAELSRHLVSLLFFAGTIILFALCVTSELRLRILFIAAALDLSSYLTHLYLPGTSLLGVRSSAAFVLAAMLMLPLRRSVRWLTSSVLLAVAFCLGTEQGMALFVAFCFMQLLLSVKERRIRPLLDGALGVLTAGGLIALFHIVIGGATGLRRALGYQLGSVVLDQFWYFGSPPNIFVPEWKQLLTDPFVLMNVPAGIIGIAVSFYLFWKSSDARSTSISFATSLLLVYGMVASVAYLGIAASAYFLPLQRSLLMSSLAILFQFGGRALQLLSRDRARRWIRVAVAGLIVAGCADLYASYQYAQLFVVPGVRSWLGSDRKPTLSRKWQNDLSISTSVVSDTPEPDFWSTYSGLTEDRFRVFNPSFDYIIHALGPEHRQAYLETFRRTRPHHAQTIRRSLFVYEEWLQFMHWDFYEELLDHYSAVAMTSHSVWWSRIRPEPPRRLSLGQLALRTDGFTELRIPPRDALYGVAILTFEYQIHNPWEKIPFIGRWPRFLVLIEGSSNHYPVSLAPYRTKVRIPIFLEGNQQPRVRITTRSLLPGPSIDARHATLELLELDRHNEVIISNVLPGDAGSGEKEGRP